MNPSFTLLRESNSRLGFGLCLASPRLNEGSGARLFLRNDIIVGL